MPHAARVVVTQRRQRYVLPKFAAGVGFDLHLPFLSEDIRAILDLDAMHLDADRYTFHPDLPGLAFVGMWDQSGGYFVPLELQARWIAYTWGGAVPGRLGPGDILNGQPG